MSQHDDQIPEDLRDIAARLSAARVTPSPLELDELRQRVHRRVGRDRRSPQRRGFASVLRMNFVAVLLTTGVVLTSGVGVVLACDSLGGGGSNTWQTTSFHDMRDASYCQNHGPGTNTGTWQTKHGYVTVTLVSDCRRLLFHCSCGGPFSFRFGGGPDYDSRSASYTTTAPNDTPSVTVTSDGSTYTLPVGS